MVVRLGAFNLTVRNEPGSVDVEVEDIRRHDQFEARTYRNDIAVLKLRTPVTFTDLISPVCLPYDRLNTVESVNSKNVIVTGYGTTAFSEFTFQIGFTSRSRLISIPNLDSASNPITFVPVELNKYTVLVPVLVLSDI